jgi:hypothetical protein
VRHCEDDVLALVALGERPSPADAEHLTTCAVCRSEIESFDRVVTAARPDIPAGPDVVPSARVWDAVAAATGVAVTAAGASARPGVVTRLRPRTARPVRRGWQPLVAVAASALLIGGAAGVAGSRLLTDDPAPVQVVARATLKPLPLDPTASGSALIVDTAGIRRLDVDVSALTGTEGFYEVWLIDASVKKMVPIGILSGRHGEFTIPADLDLGQYPVVDISAEPLDGNPTHSGKSLLRGTIPG